MTDITPTADEGEERTKPRRDDEEHMRVLALYDEWASTQVFSGTEHFAACDAWFAAWNRRAQAVPLESLVAVPAVPQGWKLVPIEPTALMTVQGGCNVGGRLDETGIRRGMAINNIYRAMLAAAPQPEAHKADLAAPTDQGQTEDALSMHLADLARGFSTCPLRPLYTCHTAEEMDQWWMKRYAEKAEWVRTTARAAIAASRALAETTSTNGPESPAVDALRGVQEGGNA